MQIHSTLPLHGSHSLLVVALPLLLACSSTGEASKDVEQGFAPLCGNPDAGSTHDPDDPGETAFDCSVGLSRLSYDSPGADAAEILELRVTGAFTAGSMRATLADCGLSVIELINGGASDCSPYRQLPVGDREIPDDGYFLLCSDEAEAALGVTCDFTDWGKSRLSAGWLQNGPSDGLRLVGSAVHSFAYEGLPPICTDDWQTLPADTGQAINDSDDIIVACGAGFSRVGLAQSPLRTAPSCAALADGGTATALLPGKADTLGDAGPGSVDESSLQVLGESAVHPPRVARDDAGRPSLWLPYTEVDAGTARRPPLPMGCQLSSGSPQSLPSYLVWVLGPLALLARRRSLRGSSDLIDRGQAT